MKGALSLAEMVWLFLFGGAGVVLRVVLVEVLDRRLHEWLPFAGTLLVNMVGCFAIGVLAPLLSAFGRLAVLGGLLGGFTTYSAFALLSWQLFEDGPPRAFFAQILLHVVGGLACVGLGIWIGRALAPESPI